MKTRIEVTWPRLTADETAELYGISKKRRKELQQIAEEAMKKVAARRESEKAEAKKAKAA